MQVLIITLIVPYVSVFTHSDIALAAQGKFELGPGWPAGDSPSYIATGDFDGDGRPDFAVVNSPREDDGGRDDLKILLNAGSCTEWGYCEFVEPATSPLSTGIRPRAVIAADLDGDADLDLAVLNDGDPSVAILLNDGAGNFVEAPTSPESLPTLQNDDFDNWLYTDLVAADLDGDGDLDLAVTSMSFEHGGQLHVLTNNGAGEFAAPSTTPVQTGEGDEPTTPDAIAAADFDDDGDVDLAIANSYPGWITLLLNDGSGAMTPSVLFDGGDPFSIVAGDFDGDGDIDLAAAHFREGIVTVHLNDGDANFAGSTLPTTVDGLNSAITAADLNGDGHADLAVAHEFADAVTLFFNDGLGNFTQPDSSPELAYEALSIVTGDYNLDGLTDIAVAGFAEDEIGILLNNGLPTLSVTPKIRNREGDSGWRNYNFIVSLDSPADGGETVDWSTRGCNKTFEETPQPDFSRCAGPDDFRLPTGTITFGPDQTKAMITVRVRGDTRKEKNEAFTVKFGDASGIEVEFGAVGVGVILNDD